MYIGIKPQFAPKEIVTSSVESLVRAVVSSVVSPVVPGDVYEVAQIAIKGSVEDPT
jgi:hypothetical protein